MGNSRPKYVHVFITTVGTCLFKKMGWYLSESAASTAMYIISKITNADSDHETFSALGTGSDIKGMMTLQKKHDKGK